MEVGPAGRSLRPLPPDAHSAPRPLRPTNPSTPLSSIGTSRCVGRSGTGRNQGGGRPAAIRHVRRQPRRSGAQLPMVSSTAARRTLPIWVISSSSKLSGRRTSMAAWIIASVFSTSTAIGEYCQLRKLRALSREPKRPTGMPRCFEWPRKALTCSALMPRRLIWRESETGRTRSSMAGMWKLSQPASCSQIISYRRLYFSMRSLSVLICGRMHVAVRSDMRSE
mmetsp:Transcript_32368/g.84883  ORF Transcript_32368/g.84883 Transcript_32368/m.84883 type:complete len:223 (-) Transcript_32368:905-1573(-)